MKEVTFKEWQENPKPRMMWVWNGSFEDKKKVKVLCVIKSELVFYPVLTVSEEYVDYCTYRHCAEIEPQHRMTNQELSFWLTEKPYREWKSSNDVVFTSFNYIDGNENEKVDDDILIRENGGEWHEPLVEAEEE